MYSFGRYVLAISIGLFASSAILWGHGGKHPSPMDFLNGNFHNHRSHKVTEEANATLQPQRMYNMRREAKYVIKPEPYSLKSKKSDPELLGPQRMISTDSIASMETNTTCEIPSQKLTANPNEDECKALLGQDRFDAYIAKYGGVKEAIKKCLIYKRTR